MSAIGLKITNFHYGHIVMPQPQADLREYPKYVHREGLPSVIVQNADEEAALLSSVNSVVTTPPEPYPVIPVPPPVAILTGSNDEKTILLAIAKEKNIKVDARWNVKRLRATVERESR